MLAIHDTGDKMHILSIDRDGNRTNYTNGNFNAISDIKMVNGKLYAVKYMEKKLVEITMENGAFSEKTLATLPYLARQPWPLQTMAALSMWPRG